MSEYLKRAEELRASNEPRYNCAQAVLVPFAAKAGIGEEEAYRIAANFGGGMKMGSVCGAVTGGLMALGLLGMGDTASANAFCRKIRENHGGLIDCRDLLKKNAELGRQKKPHCDEMVYEAVRLVEEMAKL